MTNSVSLKNLNLNSLDIKNRLNTKDGDLILTMDNVPDLYYKCQTAASKAGKVDETETAQLFTEFTERVKKGLRQLGEDYLTNYWIYYVSDQGKCQLKDIKSSMLFMVMPEGDPRDIDFGNPNNRVGFVKVCVNANKAYN